MRKVIIASIFTIIVCALSACANNDESIDDDSITKESGNDKTSYNLTQVNDWFTIELPAGYTLSEYGENVGNEGGFIIEPQAYEVLSEDSYGYGMDFTMSGFIGIINDVNDVFVYDANERNKITNVMSLWNHCSLEKIETPDDFDMPTILYSANHDLYTAADIGNLEEQCINLQPEDTTSNYWYIFFTKEDGITGYYLALDQNQFTKEDALNIFKTIKFTI